MQDRLALFMVELDRLLLVERVDVGVAAVDKRPTFDDVGLEARRGVAEGAGAGLDDVFKGLLARIP